VKAFALTEPFITVILCIVFPGRRTLMRLGKVFPRWRKQQRKRKERKDENRKHTYKKEGKKKIKTGARKQIWRG